MTYTTLAGSKGSAGSLMNWVGYGKLDVPTIIDEAQSLLFSLLRCREMRTVWTFKIGVGGCRIALPDRFLDPTGLLRDLTDGTRFEQKLPSVIMNGRDYDTSSSGSFAAAPFTTVSGSSLVTAAMTGHGLNQGGTITITGAAAVGGLTPNGTFPVDSIVDANTFVFDAGTAATSGATGGGSSATWTAANLVQGFPTRWAVYDEAVQFDAAFASATVLQLPYYRAPVKISPTNDSNFITARYPHLMRQVLVAQAAAFMKDDNEYQKGITGLTALIQQTQYESDLTYAGATLDTDTP